MVSVNVEALARNTEMLQNAIKALVRKNDRQDKCIARLEAQITALTKAVERKQDDPASYASDLINKFMGGGKGR